MRHDRNARGLKFDKISLVDVPFDRGSRIEQVGGLVDPTSRGENCSRST